MPDTLHAFFPGILGRGAVSLSLGIATTAMDADAAAAFLFRAVLAGRTSRDLSRWTA